MPAENVTATLPQDFGKIPKDYDFSTRNFNWKEYEKDFVLRTDAVWEKQQLKDYFRLYMKCFYFNKGIQRYQIFEPEDIYTILFEGWALEDLVTFPGFTPTGRTNSFQVGLGPKNQVAASSQTTFVHQDYYELCAVKFDSWWKCDMVYHDERDRFDRNAEFKDHKAYPCYKEFYESQFACQDDLFDFLMELSFHKRANDQFEGDIASWEVTSMPSVYDTPKQTERRTYTY